MEDKTPLPDFLQALNRNAEQAVNYLLPDNQVQDGMCYSDAIELDISTLQWRDFFSDKKGNLHQLWMHVRNETEEQARKSIQHFLLNKDTPEHTARFSFTPEQMADPSGLYGKWVQIFEDIRIYAGTTTLLAGYNGSGKSTLATQIAHMMTEAGVRSFLISPEMPPEVTWRIMQRQSTNSSEPTHPEWALTERHCRANFLLSTVEDRLTPSQVFAQFDMAYAKGYRMMVLDSLTCVRSGHELHEQANFSDMLRNWSRNHPDCYLLVVAHMRKPAGFIGGQISRYDIRGAGEISDLAGHVWLLQRKNKFSQKEVAAYGEYEAKLIVDKNRATGHLVCKMLRFANVSKLFHQKLSVPRYVEYLEERREEQTNVKRIY